MSENIEYRNECGCFTVDADGFLTSFTADSLNELRHAHFLPVQCERAVIDLHKIQVPSAEDFSPEQKEECRIESCQLSFTGQCGSCHTNM